MFVGWVFLMKQEKKILFQQGQSQLSIRGNNEIDSSSLQCSSISVKTPQENPISFRKAGLYQQDYSNVLSQVYIKTSLIKFDLIYVVPLLMTANNPRMFLP